TLKNNVKWSDGKPFSADDVLFTFQLLKKHDAADTSGIWSHLSSVEKKGDNKVSFHFKKANVPFQSYILGTLIVPKHIWKDIDAPTKEQVTEPVGTGPYTVKSFSPSVYVLKAREDYYGGDLPVPVIKFPSYKGNQSVTLALTQGEIDWAGIFINNADKVYASKSEHNKYWFPAKNNFTLYTNLKKPLLKDIAVRQAMSLAINREQISEKAESGFAPPSTPTGWISGRDNWVNPDLPEKYKAFEYNPEKAMQVLKDAGYKKNGDGIFAKNGKPLSFKLYTVSGWTDWATMTQLIKQDLAKVGIDVQVQQLQYGAYANDVTTGKYQLAISWTNAGFTPYKQYKDFLGSEGAWNLEQWNDPKTNQALATFSSTTDKQKQKQAIFTLQQIVAENLPSIPLVQGPIWYEYNDSKYTNWPTKENPYVDPAPHDWPAPAVVLKHLKPVQ
ncbi:MAG TPA: ABC transporter substrate-binding protein, partial [Bacillales bacterium]